MSKNDLPSSKTCVSSAEGGGGRAAELYGRGGRSRANGEREEDIVLVKGSLLPGACPRCRVARSVAAVPSS